MPLNQTKNIGGLLAQTLGGLLGSGIRGGIGRLQQRSEQRNIQSSLIELGFSPQEAEAIAKLGPQAANQIIQQRMKQQQQQQATQQFGGALQSILGLGPSQGEGQQVEPQTAPPDLSSLGIRDIGELAKIQQKQVGEKRKEEERQLQREERQTASQQRQKESAFKITQKYRKEIIDSAKGASDALVRLKKLDKLGAKGKLSSPAWLSVLKKIRLGDLKILQTPDTQEFNKLVADFLVDVKKIFGARVTQGEVNMFMKRLPTADMSPIARKEVIRDLKYFYKASGVRKKVMMDIIKQNKGIPPLDLMEQVEERAADKIREFGDKISFISGDEKPAKDRRAVGDIIESITEIPAYVSIARDTNTGQILIRDNNTGQMRPATEDEIPAQYKSNIPQLSTAYQLSPSQLQSILSSSQGRQGGF